MRTPYRPCPVPGCPELVQAGRCATHARQLEQARPNRDMRRWYHTARWRALRRQVLQYPLCVECLKENRIEPAIDVDHIVPHNGDLARFFDRWNLQGLCKLHHTQKTRAGQ